MFLLLSAAVTLDVVLYLDNKDQEEQIIQLEKTNDSLNDMMTNGEYISSEEAQKRIENSRENVKQELKEEVLKMFEKGDGVLKILENVYSEKIVVPDNSGYYFYNVDESLNKHGLDFNKFEYPQINEETGEVVILKLEELFILI